MNWTCAQRVSHFTSTGGICTRNYEDLSFQYIIHKSALKGPSCSSYNIQDPWAFFCITNNHLCHERRLILFFSQFGLHFSWDYIQMWGTGPQLCFPWSSRQGGIDALGCMSTLFRVRQCKEISSGTSCCYQGLHFYYRRCLCCKLLKLVVLSGNKRYR